jgi:hypothetical protein
VRTVLSDGERAELLIRRKLDGTFRRVRNIAYGVEYVTQETSPDFIPDYFHLIRVARGNND